MYKKSLFAAGLIVSLAAPAFADTINVTIAGPASDKMKITFSMGTKTTTCELTTSRAIGSNAPQGCNYNALFMGDGSLKGIGPQAVSGPGCQWQCDN